MKYLFKKFLTGVLTLVITAGFFFIWLQHKYTVPILMYHSIDDVNKSSVNTVSPKIFAMQLSFLKKYGFRVISLEELVAAIKTKKNLPHNSVVITFDDGYLDNYIYAFPVLKEYGFPATIFITAEQINTPGYFTWKQAHEMEKSGIMIGSHTLNHAYLPNVSPEEQLRQIKKSKEILEKGLGHPVNYLAYPLGGFSDRIKKIVQESGYEGACTTNRGTVRLNQDVYELKRIRFGNKDKDALLLWSKLLGCYNLFRTPQEPY